MLVARRLAALVPLLVLLVPPATASSGVPEPARDNLSLDGAWTFALDPDDVGMAQGWQYASGPYRDTIQVPGSWDGQGFGPETDKLRSNHVGRAWYRKRALVPTEWAGRRVFLCLGGVHRYSDAWVNGEYLGEHIGYLSPFEYDISHLAQPGQAIVVTVRVDSEQRHEVDCLAGAMDLIDAMFTPWGGIYGHVWMEARRDGWLEHLFVEPQVSPPSCRASVELAGTQRGDAVQFQVSRSGQVLAEVTVPADGPHVAAPMNLPGAPLWTPDEPNLLTCTATLLADGEALDTVQCRFGLREIAIVGNRFTLNGARIFLRGYGDDSVYPETLAPPTDVEVYRKRLRIAKRFGFNYVRHHSHFLPDEYYQACDEVGMLVQPELPNAYQFYWDQAQGAALDLYTTEWEAAIRRHRNHPSIFDWCMGNESQPFPSTAPELYRIARELDPTRPIIDTDGVWSVVERPTLDFVSLQFDVGQLPLDRPDKFSFLRDPPVPVVSHETSNYATFPRLDAASLFRHSPKPYWLDDAAKRLEAIGLLEEAPRWAECSERLVAACQKLNIEALRKNEDISGYTWWLLQDYWTGSNGLVDHYFRPKFDPAEMAVFNAPRVLLEEGMGQTYRGGERLSTTLLLSNMAAEDVVAPVAEWEVTVGGLRRGQQIVACPSAPAGEVTALARISLRLPPVDRPTLVTLRAWLDTGPERIENRWTARLYPPRPPTLREGVPVYAEPSILPRLEPLGALPMPKDLPIRAAYVVRQPTRTLLKAAARGASLVCLSPTGCFVSVPNRYKPAWWLGDAVDSNVGTVAYDHVLTRDMAPEGWCDPGWHRLIEGSQAYLLDDMPARPSTVIRGIDVHTMCRDKALVWEARVGRGSLLVSGLRLLETTAAPESEWLLAQMLRYAAGLPRPKAELPLEWLVERAAPYEPPPGPYVHGFARVVSPDPETGTWFSMRSDDESYVLIRQESLGASLTWETAPVPVDSGGKAVTLIWAGGLGYRPEPATEGFALRVGDAEVRFDITQSHSVWSAPDGRLRLAFMPQRLLPHDAAGLFYLTVASDLVQPGEPLHVSVISLGEGSRRWFGLHPYADGVP